ncbi:glycosyltransferase [Novipirellula sp. SH528]|uniref:glycosyltransferase n=1 Tax=Novipirellula sp. SH528 TaxID=3454466 RepID=UPI003FA06BCB
MPDENSSIEYPRQSTLQSSVLIPSYRRPDALVKCLQSLRSQTCPASEVIVVWQGDDEPTRLAAEQFLDEFPSRLQIIHLPKPGIVPAENAALAAAFGDIILMIDDDATAPENWVAQHLHHYEDPSVGAVGGPAINHRPDGQEFPIHDAEPVGKLAWWGQIWGNMYDHPIQWKARGLIEANHLVGYNMSFRRVAIKRFEEKLKPYWQLFELEACLAIRKAGFRVMFDHSLIIQHYPTNTAYAGGRTGNLDIKIFNPCYNRAFVLGKHSGLLAAPVQFIYLLGVGTTSSPGLCAFLVTVGRGGRVMQECRILLRCWKETSCGWISGCMERLTQNR